MAQKKYRRGVHLHTRAVLERRYPRRVVSRELQCISLYKILHAVKEIGQVTDDQTGSFTRLHHDAANAVRSSQSWRVLQ